MADAATAPEPPLTAAGPPVHDPLGGGGSRIISRPLAPPPPTQQVDAQLRAESLHYCVAQGYVEDVARLLSAARAASPPAATAAAAAPTAPPTTDASAGAFLAAALANAPLEEGETLLHVAADAGAEAIARLLLGAGARANACEALMGRTPLHYALAQGHWGAARALLEGGADPALRDLGGLDAAGVLAEALAASSDGCGGSGQPPPPALLAALAPR
jgi:hypothetical protein